MKKLIIFLILIVIFLIVIFIIYSKLPSQETVNVPSTWKTYINKRYGYQFHYPPDWTVREDYIDARQEVTILPPQIGEVQPIISVHVYHSEISFDEWVNKRFNQLRSFFPADYPPLERVIINGQNGFRSEPSSPKGRCRIWISKDSYIYEIEGPIIPFGEVLVHDFELLVNTFRWK